MPIHASLIQLDVEMHAEIAGVVSENFEFGTFMRRFLARANSYLPVYAAPYFDSPQYVHPWAIKMTLINIQNSECEHAFRFTKYFQR